MYSNDAGRINNLRIMRFAEVLLLHAEACLETNEKTVTEEELAILDGQIKNYETSN